MDNRRKKAIYLGAATLALDNNTAPKRLMTSQYRMTKISIRNAARILYHNICTRCTFSLIFPIIIWPLVLYIFVIFLLCLTTTVWRPLIQNYFGMTIFSLLMLYDFTVSDIHHMLLQNASRKYEAE